MRKSLPLILAITMLFSMIPAFANVDEANTANSQVMNIVNTDIQHVKSKQFKGTISIDDPNVKVSEVLTYDQMVLEISNDTNLTIDQVQNQICDKVEVSPISSLNPYKISNDEQVQATYSPTSTGTYRNISVTFEVDMFYKPSINFYCKTSEGGSFWGISSIQYVDMNRTYDPQYGVSVTKGFGGTVYTNLENAGTIYWIVNGDFFNNGVTTMSFGGEFGVKEFGTANFSIQYQTQHYKYCYVNGRYSVSPY